VFRDVAIAVVNVQPASNEGKLLAAMGRHVTNRIRPMPDSYRKASRRNRQPEIGRIVFNVARRGLPYSQDAREP